MPSSLGRRRASRPEDGPLSSGAGQLTRRSVALERLIADDLDAAAVRETADRIHHEREGCGILVPEPADDSRIIFAGIHWHINPSESISEPRTRPSRSFVRTARSSSGAFRFLKI